MLTSIILGLFPREPASPVFGSPVVSPTVPARSRHPSESSIPLQTPNANEGPSVERISGDDLTYRNPIMTLHPTRVAVLPSSLPAFHSAFAMEQPYLDEKVKKEAAALAELMASEDKIPEDQEPSRRLKPHSRNLEKRTGGAASSSRKQRTTKWQFGIRSRNAPAEAMLAIYKALKALGAEWEVPKYRNPSGDDPNAGGENADGSSRHAAVLPGIDDSEDDFERTDDESESEGDVPVDSDAEGEGAQLRRAVKPRPKRRVRYGPDNDWGYKMPDNPWVINARFRKDGVLPPGVLSLGQVPEEEKDESTKPQFGGYAEADHSLYVYLTIQLYSIEPDFYLVDFKCAGYERLLRDIVLEVQQRTEENLPAEPDEDPAKWRVQGVVAGADDGLPVSVAPPMADPDPRPILDDFGDDDSSDDERTGIDAPGMPVAKPGGDDAEPFTRLRVDEHPGGRAVGEKRAMNPFPFLDVVGRLIVQLAEGG